MINALLYLGASFTLLWGIAHLFPTRSVVRDFGDISEDNKRIVTMEWIGEGITLIYIGVLIIVVTATVDGNKGGGSYPDADNAAAIAGRVYIVTAATLIVMAVVSLLTGFRIDFPPFKLCPLIFTVSAVFILAGGFA